MATHTGKQKGWVALWRKLMDSEIWEQEPWRLKAWLYLLLEANHEDDDQRKLKRGEVLVPSVKSFNEALRWKKGYVWRKPSVEATKTFWQWLRTQGMIATRRTTRGTVVKIRNYSEYQDIAGSIEPTNPPAVATETATNGQPAGNRQPPDIDNNRTTKPLNQQQHADAAAVRNLEYRYGPDVYVPIKRFGLAQVEDAVRIMEARMEEGERVKNPVGLIIHLCRQGARWEGSQWQLRQQRTEAHGEEQRQRLAEINAPASREDRHRSQQSLREAKLTLSERFHWNK